MRATTAVMAFAAAAAGRAHVDPQPFVVYQPKPVRGEVRPIEAMAVFRRPAAGNWDTVRSMLAEDEQAIQA